jgi:hypothetical protein
MYHGRIEQREKIAMEPPALFFQPFILLDPLALRIKKVLDGREQALGVFPLSPVLRAIPADRVHADSSLSFEIIRPVSS